MAVSFKPLYRYMLAAIYGGSFALGGNLLAQDEIRSQWSLQNSAVRLVSSTQRQTIQMVINTSRELTAERPFKRIRIQNPNVLTAIPLEGGNRLQVSALQTGVTQIDLIESDDSAHTVEVMVLGDVRELEAILRQRFPSANLQVTPVQQGCIISGVVSSDEHIEQVMSIAELYFPTVINQVQVTGVHTVQLECQIMEVSRTKLRELGYDWAIGNGDDFVTQTVSGLVANTTQATALVTSGSETFKVGVLQNGTQFFSAIRALKQNNLVKVLANPTITAMDGRPASFNSGGEIPIIVPAGLGQVGIQFREFGTRVDFVAKVRGEGRIWLEVRPYVSEIDPTRSVTLQGISVPGLRSRFLETGVEMQAGQTLVLGGLLQSRTEVITTGLPGLADIPYLGVLFRSNREVQNEVELLISVTPNFAGALEAHELPQGGPGLQTESPTDRDFYLKGHIEVPVSGGDCQTCLPDGQFAPGTSGMLGGNTMTITGQTSGPNSFVTPTPTPNPAAMSIGPNAPKLVDRFGYPNQSGSTGGTANRTVPGVNFR